MIYNSNVKNIIYVLIIDEIVNVFAYLKLFSPLAIPENWNLEKEQTSQTYLNN